MQEVALVGLCAKCDVNKEGGISDDFQTSGLDEYKPLTDLQHINH